MGRKVQAFCWRHFRSHIVQERVRSIKGLAEVSGHLLACGKDKNVIREDAASYTFEGPH